MNKKSIGLVIAAALCAAAGNAQESDAGELVVLDAYEVNSVMEDLPRVTYFNPGYLPYRPTFLTLIPQEALKLRGVDQVSELASFAAGVTAPYRFGNLTTPHIRGDIAETYRNGQRLGASLFGVHPGFNSVDSVIIGRGPGGVVNGAGLYTGGFVSYETKAARVDGQATHLGTTLGTWAEGGSWSTVRWQVDHNQPLGERSAIRVSYEGQEDSTIYHENAGRNDYQDIYAAGHTEFGEHLKWDVNLQYRWEAAPQLLGVNRPTPLLVEDGLYYTGSVSDGVYYSGQPWFLTPTAAVDLPHDATMLSEGDFSNADYWVAQSVLEYEADTVTLRNLTLVESVDRQRYHGFEYAEWVQGLTLENRTELRNSIHVGGATIDLVSGLSLRRQQVDALVNYFNEYFFNFDITQPGPRVLPAQFPFSYYPGTPGPEGIPFFGALAGSAESTDSTLDNAAAFIESQILLTETVTVSAAARWDQWRAESADAFPPPGTDPISDDLGTGKLSWNAGLSWEPAPAHFYYITYNRAHSIAGSVTGGGILLFTETDGAGNTVGLIDPENFDNESILWEVGARWIMAGGRISTGLAFYHQQRQRVSLRSGNEDLEVRGFEFESAASEGNWRASLNVTFIEGYYRDSAPFQLGGRSIWGLFSPSVGGTGAGFKGVLDGGQVPVGDYRISGLPRWTVNAGLAWAPERGAGASVWGEWQTRQPGNLDLEYWVPAQYTLNASISWRGDGWSANLRVLNLTGEDNWIHHGDPFMNNLIIGRALPRRTELALAWDL